jgi:hypothetical protein
MPEARPPQEIVDGLAIALDTRSCHSSSTPERWSHEILGRRLTMRTRKLGTVSMNKSRSHGFDRHLLDGLGVLSAVVKAGSFVRAGESLGLTQSAVSRAVARVEHRVGVRLFRRTARAISLTDEGRHFYASI